MIATIVKVQAIALRDKLPSYYDWSLSCTHIKKELHYCNSLWSHSGLNQGPPDYDWSLSCTPIKKELHYCNSLWSHSGLNQSR